MITQEKSDLEELHKIYEYVKLVCREKKLNYNFRVDDGNYETRIDINLNGHCSIGNGKLPLIGYEMFCPDLMDFVHKKIIEYEEEAGANTGYLHAKKNKGHTEYTNTRDSRRDLYYSVIKFDVLKIWEHELKDGSWKEKVEVFLK